MSTASSTVGDAAEPSPAGRPTAGGGAAPPWFDDDAPTAPGAGPASLWPDSGRDAPAGSLPARDAPASPLGEGTARQRIFRLFVAARAAVGTALALGQVVVAVLGSTSPGSILAVVFAYAAASLAGWWYGPTLDARETASPWGLRRRVWMATIGVDLACFGGLIALSPPGGPNYGALLVMPVLMAGVFMPRRAALALAAAVTIVLLVSTGVLSGAGSDLAASLAQAGLAGSGLFVVTLLASDLAGRLEREERSARGSLERARQEAQLNRLVIDDMRDGVLVVDRAGWVRRANPAARALIAATGGGPEPPFRLRGAQAWVSLVSMIEAAFADGADVDAPSDIVLAFEPGHRRVLRVRPRFIRRRDADASEDLCVLFIEDLRDVHARTRQEKLAAMGRVSAGIAHEIRNPLAAIAQANALLAEDALDPGQQRLARIVADNVERLKRIVEDVLEAAPGPAAERIATDLTALARTVCADWARTQQVSVGAGGVLQLELPHGPVGVHFEPDHLRRVLVNLLENAWRHSLKGPGSLRVRVYEKSGADAALLVVNDGEAIPPDVERHLFEPFFSTRSRGTGLGLYICRELCSRHGARIDYRQRPGQVGPRNEFHVVMRRCELPPAGDHAAPTR